MTFNWAEDGRRKHDFAMTVKWETVQLWWMRNKACSTEENEQNLRYLGFTSTTCFMKIDEWRQAYEKMQNVSGNRRRARLGNHDTCRDPLGDTIAILRARGPVLSIDIAIATLRSSSTGLAGNGFWYEGCFREWPTPEKANGAGAGVCAGARLEESPGSGGSGEGSGPIAANTLDPPATNCDKNISKYMLPILEGQSCQQVNAEKAKWG